MAWFKTPFFAIIAGLCILITTISCQSLRKVKPEDEQVCFGGTCYDEKQMADMQEFIKPLFQKMYKKVFENNPKYAHLKYLSPEILASDPELSAEVQKELMKAAYEELKDKNMDEVLRLMPKFNLDVNATDMKERIQKAFDKNSQRGLLTYFDAALILAEDDDNDYSEEEINHLIEKADADKSGKLDFEEFKTLFPLTHKRRFYGMNIPKKDE